MKDIPTVTPLGPRAGREGPTHTFLLLRAQGLVVVHLRLWSADVQTVARTDVELGPPREAC